MSQSWINKNKEKIKIKFGKWDIIINNEFKLIKLNDCEKDAKENLNIKDNFLCFIDNLFKNKK